MIGKLHGYARASVGSDADANNLDPAPGVSRLRAGHSGRGERASWNRPKLDRLKAVLHPGDCVKVAAICHLIRSLTEV